MKKVSLSIVLSLILVLTFAASTFEPAFATPKDTVRVWVAYKPGQSAVVHQALTNARAEFHYDFPELESFVVTLPATALNGIVNNPFVALVEEDPERYPFVARPSAVAAAALDTVDANRQIVPWGIDAVQARDVWDVNRDGSVDAGAPTGAGRTVCIIDTGYYQDHQDLPNALGGFSQVDNNWARDGYGHGSHVGGTIAAENDTDGVVGVTPGTVGLYIVKYFNDSGSATLASDLVAAIYKCRDNGANVISMSLGGTRASTKERTAFQTLYDAGILHIAAAGNEQVETPFATSYPAGYTSVVSVAAIDESLSVADFSLQNSDVEIAAPGVGVLSTIPYVDETSVVVDNVAYSAYHIEFSGRGTASGALVDGGICTSTGAWSGKVVLCQRGEIDFYTKVLNVQNSGGAAAIIYNNEPGNFLGTLGEGNTSSIVGISISMEDGQYLVTSKLGQIADVSSTYTWPASGYEAWDGTSMATPHVSAVAALIWSFNPSLTNVQIREAMNLTAIDLGAGGRNAVFGYGLVQAADALAYLGGGTTNTAPVVTITAPANGASFTTTDNITFAGAAVDAEDGTLSTNLVWTSNVSGQIGTGATFTRTLPAGTHTITTSVTDSGGLVGTKSITITVTETQTSALNATVITNKASYVNKEKVTITVTVTSGGTPVGSAPVTSVVTTANNTKTTLTGTTGTNGVAILTYTINSRKGGTGTYSIAVTASKTGYVSATASTTFVVQ
jgi:subtilisin family serine protease